MRDDRTAHRGVASAYSPAASETYAVLLIGPPGSGKTDRILNRLETAIRTGQGESVKLLVPTASMKRHLHFMLARRGLMVPTPTVSTLTEFVREVTPEVVEPSEAVADRLLKAAIERVAPDAFGSRTGSGGLRGRVAALIAEFWSAGADNLQLEPAVRGVRQGAFQSVFREYEESLAALGYVHRNQRIAQAAAALRERGLGDVRDVFVAGFDNLTRQQEELLGALQEQAEQLVVAMPDGLPRYPLEGIRSEYLPPNAAAPVVEIVEAASPRAEILEIARRILESERPLHEHGIVVRTLEQYESVLQEVFDTLRIPFRVWEHGRLIDHGVSKHILQWLRIIDRRFPAEQALAALASPLTPTGSAYERDAFDFAARDLLPGDGLDFLQGAAARFAGPRRFLKALEPVENWHRKRFGAPRWHRECLALLPQLQELPVPADGESFERTRAWREAIQARVKIPDALQEVTTLPEFQGRHRISLGTFVEALEDVMRSNLVPVPDHRFEVVHVLPILESRQWSIPVVFVCGLAEGWFPKYFTEDFLFDDADRQQLRSRGIRVRTSADRAEDERFLYRIATTRASEQLVCSYPRSDALGKPLMRSTYLADAGEAESAGWTRLADATPGAAAERVERVSPSLHGALAERNQSYSVTGIQNFRQCPQLYFAGHTLRLRTRPVPPERRLDAAQIGMIVHEALALWNSKRGPMGEIVDSVFGDRLANLNLDASFRTEQLRTALRADLERFASEQTAAQRLFEGAEASFESDREYRVDGLGSAAVVRCRIDRYDLDSEGGCYVTDYKYARPDRVKTLLKEHQSGDQLQLTLYLAALAQELDCEPAGMALCGLKGETSYEGLARDGTGGLAVIGTDELSGLVDQARSEAAAAIDGVLRGSVAVEPKDRTYCERLCDFHSVCRVHWSGSLEEGNPRGSESCS